MLVLGRDGDRVRTIAGDGLAHSVLRRSAVASSQRSRALEREQRRNDGSWVEAWSRRRLGLVATGLTASLLGLVAAPDSGAAKRGKKRKRRVRQTQGTTGPQPPASTCAPLGGGCTPGQSLCCGNHVCIHDPLAEDVAFVCCKGQGESCSGVTGECCAGLGLNCTSGTCQKTIG
jgi:hypothetical protein